MGFLPAGPLAPDFVFGLYRVTRNHRDLDRLAQKQQNPRNRQEHHDRSVTKPCRVGALEAFDFVRMVSLRWREKDSISSFANEAKNWGYPKQGSMARLRSAFNSTRSFDPGGLLPSLRLGLRVR